MIYPDFWTKANIATYEATVAERTSQGLTTPEPWWISHPEWADPQTGLTVTDPATNVSTVIVAPAPTAVIKEDAPTPDPIIYTLKSPTVASAEGAAIANTTPTGTNWMLIGGVLLGIVILLFILKG
jgi:hypothetical protein